MSIAKRLFAAGVRELWWRSGTTLRRLHDAPGRWVMMVHGVGDGELGTKDFAANVAWLKAHFRVVKLEHMLESVQAGRRPADGGEVAITFDDGLRNQATQAYPVLRRYQAPASIFVCPGLIESGAWLWNHDARARLRRLAPSALRAFAEHVGRPDPAQVEHVVDALKDLPVARRREAQEELRRATPDFTPTEAERLASDLLNWDEIQALDPELVSIGSHTVTHPILPTLDDAELEYEIAGSRDMLEHRLRRKVEWFCYPNGASDSRAQQAVAKAYRGAVTTRKARLAERVDPRAIPRLAMESPCSLLAWRMLRTGT